MDIFLKLRHWHLFLLLFVLPFLTQVTLIGITISEGDPSVLFAAFPWVIIFYLSIFAGWFWATGTLLHARLPHTVRMNLRMFRFCLLFPVIYITLMCMIVSYLLNTIFTDASIDPVADLATKTFYLLPVLLPLHLGSVVCMIYCIYFLAKLLKCVEVQQDVSIGDFIGELVLIWILPVGIWFIQPRINAIYEAGEGFPSAHV